MGGAITAFVLVTIALFLAVDAGYFLYRPARFAVSLPFGVLNIIRGNVQVLKKDALKWEKADDSMALEPGSRVRTSPDAHAVIAFTIGTTSKLEPGTDLIVDKISEGQSSQAYAVVLKQQSGMTWNQVDKAAGGADFQINTASAGITVHGTLFTTEVDASGKTIVQTTEGKVSVSAGGSEVQVPAGMMTEVKPGDKPSPPVAIPPAKNELVITITQPAYSLLKDPSGSSAGYSSTGTKVNQISGTSLTEDGQSVQTIHLREPQPGDYTLAMHGIASGTGDVSVEGIVGGKTAFLHIESCNITAAKDTLLKLHYDIIEGLLQRADTSVTGIAAAATIPATPVVTATATEPKPTSIKPAPSNANKPPTTVAEKEPNADKGLSWLGADKNTQLGRLVSVACFIFLITVIFIFMRRKS
jgi:hypothetical protein